MARDRVSRGVATGALTLEAMSMERAASVHLPVARILQTVALVAS